MPDNKLPPGWTGKTRARLIDHLLGWSWTGRPYMIRYRDDTTRPVLDRPSLPIEDIFWENDGTLVHKWHNYLPLYERYFARYRGKPVRFLEIGVSKGGSLAMWRKYFGPEAIIYGIDIDPACARFDGRDGQVRVGSQADPAFLKRVVDEMGGLDLVLDDGSHMAAHIRASLDVLFPRLAEDGLYMIEDVQTQYWRRFAGGMPKWRGFIGTLHQMIDDLHHWYHPFPQKVKATAGWLAGIHIYEAVVVLEKGRQQEPRHSRVGRNDD